MIYEFMNEYHKQAYQELKARLTKGEIEKTRKLFNDFNRDSSEPTDKDDRLFWYMKSYPLFLRRFAETKPFNDNELTWIERTAYVFSWIPKIPVVRLDRQSMSELCELENSYSSISLWEIGTESYLGSYHNGERIFGANDGRFPVRIEDCVQSANLILNYGKTRLNLPTTTKLLHFMLPELFPIFDKNICNAIYGNEGVEHYRKYHAYIFALQDFLVREIEIREFLKMISHEVNLSVLRIIDQVLFIGEVKKNDK